MAERDEQFTELPLDGAGTRLRRAREAAGLSLADIAARTRIAERHLVLIEGGNFIAMASRAYAVGFSRSYARTVGLDEQEIARSVRDEMARQEPDSDRYQPATFEPGDPARVPGPRMSWIAALAALAVIALGYGLWRSFFAPAVPVPEVGQPITTQAASEVGQPTGTVPQAGQGPVVFTALEPGVWVKFYDAGGNQLLQKQLALGETFTVPADAAGPMIRTARPDALMVSVGGRVLPKLAEGPVTISDVPVGAAALLARVPGAPQAAGASPAAPAPSTGNAPRPVARASPAERREPSLVSPPVARRPVPAAAPPSPAAGVTATPSPAATPPQSSTVSQ